MIRVVFKILVLLLGCNFLLSCSPFSSKKSPVILILLESFSEKDFLCSDPRLIDGLDSLLQECESFIRFTHSFSPSSMTQTAVASLLTGETVKTHKVVHNGAQAISGQFQTLAELALTSGMRTAFFSGGVPLLPKFGVSQGYELFNDSFNHERNSLFRPFYQTTTRAMKWLDNEVGRKSFFMTIYVPDLLHKNYVTEDNYGEERPLNRNSRLQELYESTNELIVQLKKRKKWENSHIVILGLNGEKETLVSSNPLSAQHLHVPLQIKLSKEIQSNLGKLTGEMISFSRLGTWLQKLISYKPSQGSLIFSPMLDQNFIPQMSHWKQWLSITNWADIGLRKKQYLFGFIPKFQIFNSFKDKKENEPLEKGVAQELFYKYELESRIKSFFSHECYDASIFTDGWSPSGGHCLKPKMNNKAVHSLSLIQKWSEIIWNSETPVDSMSQLVNKAILAEDDLVISWLAYHSLYQKKWASLFELGNYTKNKAWMLIAQMNLRETPSFETVNCLKYFVGESHEINNFYKYCPNSELRKVVEGIGKLRKKQRPSDSFWSQITEIKNYRRAKDINLKLQFVNDIRVPFDFKPSLAELYFFLPENAEYQKLIKTDKT